MTSITESETLLFGRDFGVTPDVQSSPGETLYVVSLSLGSIFELARLHQDEVAVVRQ